MALDKNLQDHIVNLTDQHWSQHVQDRGFAELINGKEPGHRMADYVDDRTCSLLKVHLDTRYEGDTKGSPRKRSMGDIWISSQGIFNPINVKTGLQAQNGQPNVVSMQKLLDYLFNRWIDSYHLLIIKFAIADEITHKSYLIDLLDWTDYITYDAGPGQIMLKEKDLFNAFDSGHISKMRPVKEKVESLFQLFENQLRALIVNRQDRIHRQRSMLQEFLRNDFVVNQSNMRFVP